MYMNVDLFDLERFVVAQDAHESYKTALKEIKDGYKKSHWMWYVFPQIQGLGHSLTSQKYSIKSLLEAKAYLEHDVLRARLYEVVNALPVNGDAEYIFGMVDAKKLRSCLTLFDIVSPQDVFADFLGNYFNNERCERTMQIVSSELSYYNDDDAFERNGIYERPRAFLEGIDGSERMTQHKVIGTLLDLMERGETMRKLLSDYFWKKDISAYRVSCVRCALLVYMRSIVQEFVYIAKDYTLLKEYKAILIKCESQEDSQILEIADSFDALWVSARNDKRLKPVIEAYLIESLCKETEKVPEVPQEFLTMMYGQVRTLIDLLKELNKQNSVKNRYDAEFRLTELVKRNVRYGDQFAFMAVRTLWSLMSQYEFEGKAVDIERLEKDMLSFHDGNELFKSACIEGIFYNYSVRKIIKYIQFLNEFRRYSDYDAITSDLRTIPFSHCSGNDSDYYFSFSQSAMYSVREILYTDWENITRDGLLDNDLLEQVAFGRFDSMVKEYGLKETIRIAYDDVGCHPEIQAPKDREDGVVWGPIYKIRGSHIEKGCSDFRRWPWTNTCFEMKFASEILDKDDNYVRVETDWRGVMYLPVSDYTLPVYSRYKGRLHFDSHEEKMNFIKEHKSIRNAD
ncbi:MAG: DUF1810 domain-containing protein [Bacteroidales bacterium]|nr:DUF1810 domain-containing protein [Bacteroidales bacterium]